MLRCAVVQVSSFGEHPLLQPAAAQLSNAMVAVLGPQFTLGSLAYSRCKTLVTDNTGTCKQHTLKAAVLGCALPAVQDAGSAFLAAHTEACCNHVLLTGFSRMLSKLIIT